MPKARTTPTIAPPGSRFAGAGAEVGTTEPKSPTEAQLASSVSPTVTNGKPTMLPSQVAAAEVAAEAAITATWRSGVTVTALWSINEVRNAWMYVPTVGWRKLYNGRDGSFTALVTLAAQARQTGRPIAFREEADGMVYEIYLW